jgi:hypothetical protein
MRLSGDFSIDSAPEAAVDVEHGHVIDLHAGNRGGDQVADRLSGGAVVAAVCPDDHGGRGGLTLAPERAFVGEHDMHPRRPDRAHHLDRARELAFERPQAGHVLHE